jgi:hypothetical protein
MTTQKSRVEFDSTADLTIKGKVGGREVEYTGSIAGFDVLTDDKSEIYPWYLERWEKDWPDYNRMNRPTTYFIKFEEVDGKAITAKISERPVTHTARTYGPKHNSDTAAIEKCRTECGAPDGANYYYHGDDIVFTWTVGV